MGGTNGISRSGSNYQIHGIWSNQSLKATKAEQTPNNTPIKMTSNNVKREELGFINPYNSVDATIAGARDIASKTNMIMTELGYPNYKVTPKTVTSVSENINGQTLPTLNIADDNAVAARVSNPKGPFADLFA